MVAVAALFTASAVLGAQTVRVRLLDEETRQPLVGVLVAALEANDAIGPTVLASSDGIAVVRAKNLGPHRLLIRHIGFAPVTTDPVNVTSEAGQTLDIIVPAHRITLNAVHVVGNATCPSQAQSPSETAAQAWTEVRTALEASTLTRDQRLVATTALRFQRDVRVDGHIDFADTTQRGRSGERPFYAPEPAALERDGYFKHHEDGSENFYAPDEAVLLSPGFTQRHCVTILPDVRRDANGTQIALAFMPRDRDTRPEIKGLIWIDSATSELRRIEFEYMRISLRAPADSLGGSVDFRHLTSGAWIVSAWVLRMPRFRQVNSRTGYDVLDGYIEVGGSSVVTRDMAAPALTVPRTIAGSVYDSIAQRPLTGAHVHLVDAGRDAVADSLGRFRFDSVTAGEHSLWVDHPTLDALGLFSLAARVDAAPQLVTTPTFAIPSFATFWRRACGSAPLPGDGDGFVFGRISSNAPSAPVRAAAIEISWPAASGTPASLQSTVRAKTDSTGDYVLCGIPDQQVVTLSTVSADSSSLPVSFRIGAERVARRDLTFLANTAIDSIVGDTSRVALFQTGEGATLSGVVRDSAGRAIRDAHVAISGVTGELRSDAMGAFMLRGVPPGARVVAINASGYVAERRVVNLAAQDSSYIALSLTGGVTSGKAHTLRVVSADGKPIMYANVSIEGGTTQITNENGEVALGVGHLNNLNLSVRRIGFSPWFSKIEFPDTSSVLTVTLARTAQQLGAVRVTGQKDPVVSPFLKGFYDRWMDRQKGLLSAVFIGPEELESRHPDMITNMLRGLNGFCLYNPVFMDPSKVIIFASHSGSLQPNQGCPNCPAAIVIDGMQQYPPAGGNIYIDMLLGANDVMAIEAYPRAGNMPLSLQVNDTKCGVVAFWTGSRH
jgi:hypothetical protein